MGELLLIDDQIFKPLAELGRAIDFACTLISNATLS
jgi:hypothetical protein